MARHTDYNPLIYTPNKRSLSRAKNKGTKALKSYLRSCAGNYTKRKEVRELVLNRDKNQCVNCGSKSELELDHIVSVYRGWKEGIPLESINSIKNLQTLCRSCNARKDVIHG